MMDDDDDWHQCASWLNRCHVLPNEHPTLQEGGTAIFLVQALMDGVVLCQLLVTLSSGEVDPRSMKDFSPRTQNSQFQCTQNIRLFIQLVEEKFGLSHSDVIDAADLYQAKNFGKVIVMLSKLSNSPLAQRSGIPGFPPENRNIGPVHEYYNNLEDIAAVIEKTKLDPDACLDQIEDEKGEKIYDTVVHGGSRNRISVTAEQPPTTARECCIKEIVDTERNYVEALKMLIEKYKKPLSTVLSQQEVDVIFKYIEDLHAIHRELQSNLSLAVNSGMHIINLHEVFLQAREKLLIYGMYCGHVQKAQSLVTEIIKNDVDKRTMIETCQKRSDNFSKFQLTELLTVPMQRVLKYHLLLENLVRLTKEDGPEKQGLKQAHEAMRDLAVSINEVKRDLDMVTSIDQIQASMLEITLPADKKLSDYGRRHKDGELKVQFETDQKPKLRHAFLFDKMLLLCKSKGENYIFKEAYHIINNSAEETVMPLRRGDKGGFPFTLPISADKNLAKVIFYSKSDELRKSWIQAARAAVGNQYPPGATDNGYHFEMTTFSTPTHCDVCKKLLRGVFFQGYRCRESWCAVHKDCIKELPPRTMNGGGPPALRQRRGKGPSVPYRIGTGSNWGSTISLPPPDTPTPRPTTAFPGAGGALGLNRRDSLPAVPGRVAVGWAQVMQSYVDQPAPQQGRYPLQLPQGDIIELLNKDDPNWWEGRHGGHEGWFPASFVVEQRNASRSSSREKMAFSMAESVTPRSSGMPESPPSPGGCSNSASGMSSNRFFGSRYSQQPSMLQQDLNGCAWYVGELDRNEATTRLSGLENGTFLVRVSKNLQRFGEFSLSVVFQQPRHIRIQKSGESYYLCDQQTFPSIQALVEYYMAHSLNECFDSINTYLVHPFRKPAISEASVLFYARVRYDFSADSDKMLPLQLGERVAVISTASNDRGWWKGRLNGRTGFFPVTYVQKEEP